MKIFNVKFKALYIMLAVLLFCLITAVGTFMGCTINVVDPYLDYTAKAVNVKASGDTTDFWTSSSSSLAGAQISMYAFNSISGTYSSTPSQTVAVSSTGYFTFAAPTPGSYKVTGVLAGWTFVPRFIDITDNGAETHELFAYPTVETVGGIDYEAQYTFIASWQNTAIDVDLTLTYGKDDGVLFQWDTNDNVANPDRLQIYYGDSSFAGVGSRDGIYLNRDVKGTSAAGIPRVETISIYSNAWFIDGDTIKVYVDAPQTDQLLTGNQFTADGSTAYAAAIVQLDLMRRYDSDNNGSLDTDAHYGTWYVPWNTYEDTIQLINATYTSADTTINFASANGVQTIKSINEEK